MHINTMSARSESSRSTSHCENCATECNTHTLRCEKCGHVSSRFTYRSRVAASALALFGGALGLHRFYLGQWRGVIYLLFCWTPVPWLVALVECIIFMTTDQRRWNQRYNHGIGNGHESARVLAVFLITGFLLIAGALITSLYIPFKAFSDLSGLQNQVRASQTLGKSAQRYIQQTGRRPSQLSDLSLPGAFTEKYGQHIQIVRGRISMQFDNAGNASAGELIMEPVIVGDEVLWDCSESTVPAVFHPNICK